MSSNPSNPVSSSMDQQIVIPPSPDQSISTSSHCDANSLTDSYGLLIQLILAALAFASLVLKRLYCEPRQTRRPWIVWLFDTSKQAVGAGVIHFLNVFLARILGDFQQKRGDPCTWYVVSFLLDSTVGLSIIYLGIRLVTCVASRKIRRHHRSTINNNNNDEEKNLRFWSTLKFGEYGKPPQCRAWANQCAVFVAIIIVEKILVTIVLEFRFWRHVREIILSPITNPKLEVTIVMLIIPFFMNTLIFWVVDNFTMRKIKAIGGKAGNSNSNNSTTMAAGNLNSSMMIEDEEDEKDEEKGGLFGGANKKKSIRSYVGGSSSMERNVSKLGLLDDDEDDESEKLIDSDGKMEFDDVLLVEETITNGADQRGLSIREDSIVHQRHNSASLM